jgi:hypothetical protein
LWICLLLLALPLQGLAAATMVFCAPGHHGSSAAAGEEHAHHASEHASMPASSPDHADSEAPAKHLRAGTMKCSACASCFFTAVPSAALVFEPPEFGPATFVALVPVVAPFIAAGPDRPPRSFLA